MAAVTVSLSRGHVRVLTGTGSGRRQTAHRELEPHASHRLTVTVEPDRTVVVVDGSERIETRNARLRQGEATGGLAFSTRTGRAGVPYPRLAAMTIASAPPTSPKAGP